jgi:putative membrane protein
MGRAGTVKGLTQGASERALALLVYGLSATVCVLVVALMAFPEALRMEGLSVAALPGFHAVLNGTTAVLLTVGFLLIRAGKVRWHRRAMITAFILSCVFLVSYVLYHSQAPSARFGGEGWVRGTYFAILISHVTMAPVVLPLALYTVARALLGDFDRHRRIARWTLPAWLYVAVTGVVVYWMMVPYYAH